MNTSVRSSIDRLDSRTIGDLQLSFDTDERETIQIGADVPQVVYQRLSQSHERVVVFLPGGGHRGRIAYGHNGTDRAEFLDYWLSRKNIGLIAFSYPLSACEIYKDLKIEEWAQSTVEIVARILSEKRLQTDIVVAGWSMAGRAVVQLTRAARRKKLPLLCFVSLAATPPLFNMVDTPATREARTVEGWWSAGETVLAGGRSRKGIWFDQLRRQATTSDVCPISEADYYERYLVDTPMRLRGEPLSESHSDLAASLTDMGSFAWEDYPWSACIVPNSPRDPRHALSDQAAWTFLTVQFITHSLQRRSRIAGMGVERWGEICDLMKELPKRLCRRIDGGHFFFVGQSGARQTSEYVRQLATEVAQLRQAIPEIEPP